MKLLERLTRRDDRLSFSLLAAGFGGTGIAVLAAVCASLPGLQWDRPFGPLAMIGLVDLSSGSRIESSGNLRMQATIN